MRKGVSSRLKSKERSYQCLEVIYGNDNNKGERVRGIRTVLTQGKEEGGL